MANVIIDTDILIEALRGSDSVIAEINKIQIDNIRLSSITLMELYQGARDKADLRNTEKMLSGFTVIPVDEQVSTLATRIVYEYGLSHGAKLADALIGATAILARASLYTRNTKDFHYLPDLQLHSV